MENKPQIEPHTWNGPEYKHAPKSIDWLWTIGLLAVVGFVVALFFHNYIFGIFILVSGATLIFFSIRHPQDVSFLLTKDSINIAGKEYPYKKLKGFKIKENEEENKLLIMTDGHFLPILTIPLPIESSKQVYDILIEFLPELPLEESPSMIFMEKLGF